jgi:hypothetical protein
MYFSGESCPACPVPAAVSQWCWRVGGHMLGSLISLGTFFWLFLAKRSKVRRIRYRYRSVSTQCCGSGSVAYIDLFSNIKSVVIIRRLVLIGRTQWQDPGGDWFRCLPTYCGAPHESTSVFFLNAVTINKPHENDLNPPPHPPVWILGMPGGQCSDPGCFYAGSRFLRPMCKGGSKAKHSVFLLLMVSGVRFKSSPVS